MSNNIERIYDKNLLDDFEKITMKIKAKAVFYRCFINKKFSLAEKIKNKYNLQTSDDRITAFAIALLESKKIKNEKIQRTQGKR